VLSAPVSLANRAATTERLGLRCVIDQVHMATRHRWSSCGHEQ
jgi:hypothetical protein